MKSAKMLTILVLRSELLRRVALVLALGLMVCLPKVTEAAPMGTAFTYQGRLIDANNAADGLYDFQFKLFDDANTITGNQVGSDVNNPDVDVIDGYFTVELDFGSDVFDGNAVWLEIGVRAGELEDPNVYTVLMPRQEVTPVPYALQTRGLFVSDANNVGIGTTGPTEKLDVVGNVIASLYYDRDNTSYYLDLANSGTSARFAGKVGIGTTNPDRNLDIRHSNTGGGIEIDRSVSSIWSGLVYENNGAENWFVGMQADSNNLLFRDDGARNAIVIEDGTGNVGIGTTDPGEKLEVNGHAIAAPIVGKWQCSSTDVGSGYYQWDSQLINTNTNYFSWSAGTDAITILKAGYYSISAVLMKSELPPDTTTYAIIMRNGTNIAYSWRHSIGGYDTHDLTLIEYFAENDVVRCWTSAGNRHGAATPYTVLSIYRLN